MFGSLLIMAIITIVNMKRRVLLHKLILLEVCSSNPIPNGKTEHDIIAPARNVTWDLLLYEF